MGEAPGCHVLAIMGSGETSPTMVTIHKELAARLGTGRRASAVLLDTPYAFQENAADISARAQAYFARSVGLPVTVAPETDDADGGGIAALRAADWVFSGPGSPTFALSRWRRSAVAQALRDRIAGADGVTVLASAAAATIGTAAVPVYEIYKAGAAPHWVDGLDLLGVLGFKVAVIPHYDNAEGGSHDTRYCYLGERRLRLLERELRADAVLGVDEHTAVVFDLGAGAVGVCGRGGLTVRRSGISTVLPAGSRLTLACLRALVTGGADADTSELAPRRAAAPRPAAAPRRAAWASQPAPPPLPEVTREAGRRFDAASRRGDASGMVAAILDLEEAIHAWAADTDEDQGTGQARAVLRGLVARLGRAAAEGVRDPGESLRPVVEPLIALRASLRSAGDYPAADAIRRALAAAGLQVRDTADGTQWAPRAPG